MDHAKGLAHFMRKWFVSLLWVMGIIEVIMFARVTSADQTGIPATGLPCFPDCPTCPVICSPPQPYYFSSPPPPPPPPVFYYFNSPPTSTPPSPPLPPPPYPNYLTIPSCQPPPGMQLQGKYSYPYYYFCASQASFLSLQASISVVLLLSFHVMLLCW